MNNDSNKKDSKIYLSDWLGSNPVFYNEKTNQVSENINDVIDYNNLEFHPEGLNNYLQFGYSVFEQTPIKDVKFLRHSSKITFDNSGKIVLEHLTDPVEKWLETETEEEEAINIIQKKINEWEANVEGEIIIPSSGGYDSRMLNLSIKDKSRIRSFTYGISTKQTDSFEVVLAKKMADILGTKWEQIPLTRVHNYFDKWDSIYGISTHAHGMYHIEFYNKIMDKVQGNNPFLSGIIGDAWAGNVNLGNIILPSDVIKLGYSHAVHADTNMSQYRSGNNLIENYFEAHKHNFKLPSYRVVASMRFKIILLSYLMKVPNSFGMSAYSPFLDIEVAMAMLNIPAKRRENRIWQKELFKRHNLDLESLNLKVSFSNNLDIHACINGPLKPLNKTLLREVIKPVYIDWINKKINSTGFNKFLTSLLVLPNIGKVLSLTGYRESFLKSYYAYLTIKPIENLLARRNAL